MGVRRYGPPPVSPADIEAARDELDEAEARLMVIDHPGLTFAPRAWTPAQREVLDRLEVESRERQRWATETGQNPGDYPFRELTFEYSGFCRSGESVTLTPTMRWRPSPADEHDMGSDCGEIECERCNP